jgi:hypothetical protein
MVKSPLWLRVLAPCLALSVGGGYVWMRHKKAEAAEIQAQAAETEAAKKRTMVLPGSKAPARIMDAEFSAQEEGVLPLPLAEDAKPVDEKLESSRVLPGSKIGIIELDDIKDARILPGSKSAGVFEPQDLQQKAERDRAITRDNIDEVLNDPKRAKPPAQNEEPKVEQKQEPAKPVEP